MEEKIIIDGVNVSECEFYLHKDGSCMSHDCECTLCKHNDCYYKQLQQLKEENEDLKETIQELNQSIQTCNVERIKLYRKLEKVEVLWSKFSLLSPLGIGKNQKLVYELDKAIRGEE